MERGVGRRQKGVFWFQDMNVGLPRTHTWMIVFTSPFTVCVCSRFRGPDISWRAGASPVRPSDQGSSLAGRATEGGASAVPQPLDGGMWQGAVATSDNSCFAFFLEPYATIFGNVSASSGTSQRSWSRWVTLLATLYIFFTTAKWSYFPLWKNTGFST